MGLKATPLERAIAVQKDRRVRYDQRMRDGGHKRLTLWCPEPFEDDVRELVKMLAGADAQAVGEGLRTVLARGSRQPQSTATEALSGKVLDDGGRS